MGLINILIIYTKIFFGKIAGMVFKYTVLALAVLIAVNAAPLKKISKREVIVDKNGFYLGGGSNNNIRESSQIFDLGGPIVNPWINAFTQPHLRVPLVPPILPVPIGGIVPPPVGGAVAGGAVAGGAVAGGAVAGGAAYGNYQQQKPTQQYGRQPQQQVAQQPQQQFAQQPQQQVAQPQQQQFAQQPQYQQQAYQQPQQQYQQKAYQQPQQQYQQQAYQQPQQQYHQPAMPTYQQQTYQQPQQQYQQPAMPTYQTTTYAPPTIPSYGQQAPAAKPAYPAPESDYSTKPFTAVFLPGKQTHFKLGTPGDFSQNSYTPI